MVLFIIIPIIFLDNYRKNVIWIGFSIIILFFCLLKALIKFLILLKNILKISKTISKNSINSRIIDEEEQLLNQNQIYLNRIMRLEERIRVLNRIRTSLINSDSYPALNNELELFDNELIKKRKNGLKQEDIDKIFEFIYEKKKNENICSICIEDFQTGDLIKVLPCKHNFHTNCVNLWLLKNNSCPNCKRKIIF